METQTVIAPVEDPRALQQKVLRETALWLSANLNNPRVFWPRKPVSRPAGLARQEAAEALTSCAA